MLKAIYKFTDLNHAETCKKIIMASPLKPISNLILLAILVFINGCTQDDSIVNVEHKVSLQLKWVHQAQFAGFYVAKEDGIYGRNGLDVELFAGGPEINQIEAIESGKVQFAIVAAEEVIKARDEGLAVVAIAAIYRRNPNIFMTLKQSGIQAPKDFTGRTIAYSSGDAKLLARAMLEKPGLDISALQEKEYDYKYESFKKGEVDISSGYLIGGYLRLKRSGLDVHVIWPDDYGVHFYGDVLVTTEDYLQQNAEIVTSFLKASLEGWKVALQEQDKGVIATMKYAMEADTELQKEMLSQSFPLIQTGEDRIGWMQQEVWTSMIEHMSRSGIISTNKLATPVFDIKPLLSVYTELK